MPTPTNTGNSTTHKPRYHLLYPLLLAAIIYAASNQSELASPVHFLNFDKIVHFFVFGLFSTLIIRLLKTGTSTRRILISVAIVSLYGFLDEFHQSFTPGRSVDFFDWTADTLGALTAALSYTFWPLYRNILETPLRFRKKSPHA